MVVSSIKQTLAEQENREQLLKQLEIEKPNIVAAIEQFYESARTEAGSLTALSEVTSALDRVINLGDWETSTFLRNAVKKLKKMREEAWKLSMQLQGKTEEEKIELPQLEAGMTPVYISIFQHKAHNYKDWEYQLNNLPQYVFGRPIYREEKAVQQSIRTKLMQNSDAYVCVGVTEKAIQIEEFHPSSQDKWGNRLLQLISGAVRKENILEFVYMNKRYYFVNNKLIEK